MRFSISNKINLLAMGLIILFGLLLGLYFIKNQSRLLNLELNERATVLINNLSLISEYPVLIRDHEAIEKLAKGVLTQKDVVFCRFDDKDGMLIYQEGLKKGPVRQFTSRISTKKVTDEQVEELILGMTEGKKEEIGKIHLAVSLSGLNQKIDRVENTILVVVFFSVILVSLANFLLLKLVLGRPVDLLVKSTKRIAKGDFKYKISVKSRDEIGVLAVSFNKMTEDLHKTTTSIDRLNKEIGERKQAEEALQKAHDELERRIEERTAELVTVNKQLMQEIEERNQAEKALEESEQRFRLAAESVSDLIYEWDISTNRLDWFGDIEGVLGFESGEFPRTLEAWMNQIHPDDQARLVDSVKRHRKSTSPIYEEYQIRRKDGTMRYWVDRGVPVLDSGGRPLRWIGACIDITERKRVEEALRESEERFNSFFTDAPAGLVILDEQLRYVKINKTLAEMNGLSAEEHIGKNIKEVIPDVVEDVTPMLQKILKTGEPIVNFVVSGETLGTNGTTGHWVSSSFPVSWGKKRGIGNIVVEITDQIQAEEALRKEHAFRKSIIDHVAEGLCVCHDTNEYPYVKFTLWNDRMTEITGYTMEEINRLGWYQTVYPDPELQAKAWERMERMRLGDDLYAEEWEIIRSDGEKRILGISTSILKIDKDTGYVLALMHDITEHKIAEERIRKSKILLQSVFDGITEPLIMLDKNSTVRVLNRAALEYYGAEFLDVVGKSCHQVLKGRAEPCEECSFAALISKGTQETIERKGLMDPDRLEQVIIYPFRDKEKQPGSAIVRIRDVTDERKMQKQLIQSEKLAAIGLLTSGIAHEINNPNSFISFNIPILKDYLKAILPVIDDYAGDHPDFELFEMPYPEFRKDIFKLIEDIEHGSVRINTIVSELKEFIREEDKDKQHLVELKQLIERGVSICRSRLKKNIRSFEINLPEELPPTFTVPQALEQVLVNLLLNAAQAVVDKEDSRVKLDVRFGDTREEYLILEVRDNGFGMDEENKQRVFDPFFTTKGPDSGTGLGLYVCHNLVTGLGGRIDVESKPGIGSTFRVILPDAKQGARD